MPNVFVLCTGRCGSVTFVAAARHIGNFTTGHESRAQLLGGERFDYPPDHIEADNRLSWMLGRLGRVFGTDAYYVHLRRDPAKVAGSFESRWGSGIIRAYHDGILLRPAARDRLEVCADYVDTVTANIEAFLADKPRRMEFRLEQAEEDWRTFWQWVGAEGDLQASLAEWRIAHNPTKSRLSPGRIWSRASDFLPAGLSNRIAAR